MIRLSFRTGAIVMKIRNMTNYLGPWVRTLVELLLLIAGGHLVAVYCFKGTELFSPIGLLGSFLFSVVIAISSYYQKRNRRFKLLFTKKVYHDE